MPAHAVSVTPDFDDVATVEEPVQKRSGHNLVAEDPAPLLEALVGRQDGRGATIAPGDELEEEDGATLGHRQVADLVHDEKRRVSEGLEAAVEPACGLGFLQGVHQIGQGPEVDLAPAFGRLEAPAVAKGDLRGQELLDGLGSGRASSIHVLFGVVVCLGHFPPAVVECECLRLTRRILNPHKARVICASGFHYVQPIGFTVFAGVVELGAR